MRQVWQKAEDQFETFWTLKTQYCYAFEDTREAMGGSGSKKVFTQARPSDYLVTDDGLTFFAEVKSSQSTTSFNLNNVKKEQWKTAKRMVAANGHYYFFIRRELDKQWLKVPGPVMVAAYDAKKKSIKWTDLEIFKWSNNG